MKDINYFLDAERVFQKEHPNGPELYFDSECGGMTYKSYPDEFLQGGWMNKFALSPHSEKVKDAIKKYNLSEVEVLIMNCFYGNLSQYFRDDIYAQYGQIPEITKEMQTVLESFIKKAPKHKEGMLYRFLNWNHRDGSLDPHSHGSGVGSLIQKENQSPLIHVQP